MDGPHDGGTATITDGLETLLKFHCVIQIGTFKHKGQSGDVLQWCRIQQRLLPDPRIDRSTAEAEPQLAAALSVQSSVSLFIEHDPGEASTKIGRGLWKCQ